MRRIGFLILALLAGSPDSKESGSSGRTPLYVDTLIDRLQKEYQAEKRRRAQDAKSGKAPAGDVEYEETTYRSSQEILRTLRPKALGLHKEYDSHFQGRTRPSGSVTTRIWIAPDGRVLKARIVGDAIKDTAFAAKVAAFFEGLEFEPIDSKVIDSVAIPFTFPLR